MARNKKFAILCSYNGKHFHGSQINQSLSTVEKELLDALCKINAFQTSDPKKCGLQRASRTDKGVSAALNTFIIKTHLPLNDDFIDPLNELLENKIKVHKILRVTKGFVAQKRCESRIYFYYLPKTIINSNLEKLQSLKNKLQGPHDFYNFTVAKNLKDTKRFIREIRVEEAFDFYKIVIEGNSFLYNQIRKIVGYFVQQILTEEFDCFNEKKDIFLAPPEFLLLFNQSFKNYNNINKYGKLDVPESVLDKEVEVLIKDMLIEQNINYFKEAWEKFYEHNLNKLN